MDPMTIVALAAIGAAPLCAAVGAAVGYQFGRRTKTPKPPQYNRGCGHSLAAHDPDTKKCHATVLVKDVRTPNGDWIGNQHRPCACRHYVGEVPPDLIDWSKLTLPTPQSDGSE